MLLEDFCKKIDAVPMSVIEDIKAEIKRKGDYFDKNINRDIADGFYRALQIIDMYMEGVSD